MMKATAKTEEEFWASVDRSGGPGACWPWTRGRHVAGYGMLAWAGKKTTSNRVALELHLGRPLAFKRYACHTCNNPPCCNPGHLYEGTSSQNARDMAKAETTNTTKLTAAQVLKIREAYAAGDVTQEDLAAQYGVEQVNISSIVRGDSWQHVAGPTRPSKGAPRLLTTADVLAMRVAYAAGGVTQRQLAEKHGVRQATICMILLGDTWPEAGGPIQPKRPRFYATEADVRCMKAMDAAGELRTDIAKKIGRGCTSSYVLRVLGPKPKPTSAGVRDAKR
jgi:DNA-binding XRE family transcriptional regulator